jgi:hypothetical protein
MRMASVEFVEIGQNSHRAKSERLSRACENVRTRARWREQMQNRADANRLLPRNAVEIPCATWDAVHSP